ncbi:phosphatase PAP2 family protein [Acetobacter sp. TBRC 12305]|uniref:phosphatase PAP2 family protein n=1 Tax=Acetobacter garciniae TaxID=2817435 RepID=UPI001C72A0DD|nr:phosphatase PAP2 family protein [Acetobacter garciniae]MBX0345071.1 phosphatase PAP2 family protein [Acetobacter garciniae]
MKFMTDFGDEAVILPLFLVVSVTFYAMGWRRGGIVWGVGIAVILTCLVLAKLFGLYWGEVFGFVGRPFSVSGHVAASAAVYGSLLNIILHSRRRSWFLALLPPLIVAGVIGYTRLQLHAHTQAEIVSGALLGTVGALGLYRILNPVPGHVVRYALLVPLCVMLVFHGYMFHAEPLLQTMFHNSYRSASHVLAW